MSININRQRMFRVINVVGEFTDNGYADVEFWTRNNDIVVITKERLTIKQFYDLPFLYYEVKINNRLDYPTE